MRLKDEVRKAFTTGDFLEVSPNGINKRGVEILWNTKLSRLVSRVNAKSETVKWLSIFFPLRNSKY